jgi:glycosyltransferase involved in cell wall biosynthesis
VKPDVSVVVSVFNGQRHLRASLDSVLSQGGIQLELVVVDDGSTDATPSILAEIAASDDRVRLIRQENRGLTEALILGCSQAEGAFIARHDADDVSLPGRLSKQLSLLRSNHRLSFVSCWAKALGPGDEVLFEVRRPADPSTATDLLRNQRIGPSGHGSVMFSRAHYERVDGYRREFYFAQDNDLWLRLSEVGQIGYVPELLYAYRVSTAAISSSYRNAQVALGDLGYRCREARRSALPEDELLRQAARVRPTANGTTADPVGGDYFIGRCLIKRRDPRARKYLWKVIAKRPWSIGAWLGMWSALFFRATEVADLRTT